MCTASVSLNASSFSDKIVTSSFDKTARVWNAHTGACIQTFYGHKAEVVGAEFNPVNSGVIATASMDNTSRVFHVETGDICAIASHKIAKTSFMFYCRPGDAYADRTHGRSNNDTFQ